MTNTIVYRRAEPADLRPAYAVFRRSLYDYLFRQALVDEATAKDPPIETGWARQGAWIEHLWATSAENWVAVDGAGTVIGWAMSVERDSHLELTHFFVEPGVQARGIGRGLIERAFPNGRARHKSIIATQDAPALSLYLRSGVHYVTTSVDFIVPTSDVELTGDLTFERLATDGASIDASIAAVAAIEVAILGASREPDTRFLLGMRPGWLAKQNGRVVGFAFGAQPLPPELDDGSGRVTGPIGALDPADLPALVDQVVREAAREGIGEVYVTSPLSNRTAVSHLLSRGYRIDPFYTKILASDDTMRLDRWIHTGPVFIL
ncbi:MAG TPA: GNAT family N-acetyltransferase [Candidatus Sulfomarinibacteraceae bacterium]|nr:GNAT family N-acetyltransferase [Candidatus Sulfomarinibacteraceae bacterium]